MFFVLFTLFLLMMAGLAYQAAGWCLTGAKAHCVKRGIIWFNVLLLVLLPGGRLLYAFLGENLSRLGMLLLTLVFMVEIFFGLGVLLVRLCRLPFCLSRRKGRQEAGSEQGAADPGRRRFLFGSALATASLTASAYGTAAERCRTVVNRYDLPQAGLPAELEGFTVAQLSDVHLGLFYSLADWRALLEQAAGVGADVLAVTGDLFDADELNEEAAYILDEFVSRFPKGIYFCYGNHEHFRDIAQTRAALSRTRVKVLVNEALCVAGEKTSRPLWFVGVDYPVPRAQFAELQAKYTALAYAQLPEQALHILLAHHPDFIDEGAAHGAFLVLTGHTHGGQFGAFGVPLVPPAFKYMRGLYRVGRTVGYVHSGNGSWFPFRLGCPPEIAVFKLTGR